MLWLWSALALAGAIKAERVSERDVRIHSYKVRGDSADALLAAMDAKSPYVDPDGKSWPGGTKYAVSWRWGSAPGGLCKAARLRVRIDMYLPKVVTEVSLRSGVQSYLDALAVHEEGHADLVRTSMVELQATLKALGSQECGVIGEEVQNAGERALKSLAAAQRAYDRKTRHGRTQGARLRPHLL